MYSGTGLYRGTGFSWESFTEIANRSLQTIGNIFGSRPPVPTGTVPTTTAGTGQTNWLMWGAIGLGAYILLRKKRGRGIL
jgi:uncharacterized protein HemX